MDGLVRCEDGARAAVRVGEVDPFLRRCDYRQGGLRDHLAAGADRFGLQLLAVQGFLSGGEILKTEKLRIGLGHAAAADHAALRRPQQGAGDCAEFVGRGGRRGDLEAAPRSPGSDETGRRAAGSPQSRPTHRSSPASRGGDLPLAVAEPQLARPGGGGGREKGENGEDDAKRQRARQRAQGSFEHTDLPVGKGRGRRSRLSIAESAAISLSRPKKAPGGAAEEKARHRRFSFERRKTSPPPELKMTVERKHKILGILVLGAAGALCAAVLPAQEPGARNVHHPERADGHSRGMVEPRRQRRDLRARPAAGAARRIRGPRRGAPRRPAAGRDLCRAPAGDLGEITAAFGTGEKPARTAKRRRPRPISWPGPWRAAARNTARGKPSSPTPAPTSRPSSPTAIRGGGRGRGALPQPGQPRRRPTRFRRSQRAPADRSKRWSSSTTRSTTVDAGSRLPMLDRGFLRRPAGAGLERAGPPRGPRAFLRHVRVQKKQLELIGSRRAAPPRTSISIDRSRSTTSTSRFSRPFGAIRPACGSA